MYIQINIYTYINAAKPRFLVFLLFQRVHDPVDKRLIQWEYELNQIVY